VEVINIINLSTVVDMVNLVYDYIALYAIIEFDESFYTAFHSSKLQVFFGMMLPVNKFTTNKTILTDATELINHYEEGNNWPKKSTVVVNTKSEGALKDEM